MGEAFALRDSEDRGEGLRMLSRMFEDRDDRRMKVGREKREDG